MIISGHNYSPTQNLFVGSSQRDGEGIVRFYSNTTSPALASTDRGIYVKGSDAYYWNGTSETAWGGGGGGTPTWEAIFLADPTFTVTPDTTFTIAGNRNTATAVVTMTNNAGASGPILQLTNDTTSNNDIRGTSGTWAVTGTGVATVAGIVITGTSTAISTTASDVTWVIEDNDATALRIGPSGGPVMLTFDTRNSAEVLSTDALTFQVTLGLTELIQGSNTISTLRVTDNTITTFGANANAAGTVVIRSTSLTTGSLLQLNLSDTALAGGFYLNCRETVGGTQDFTIGENGVVVMRGTPASDSFTMSGGDMVMSDGSLLITDADNANTFAVVNNTATTVSVISLDGSGAFTGTDTSAFMTLMPSGLTTGTALYIATAAATTLSKAIDITTSTTTGKGITITMTGVMTGVGKALEIIADSATTPGASAGNAAGIFISVDGLTTGMGVKVESLLNNVFTSGALMRLAHSGSGTTLAANSSTGLLQVTSTMTESGSSTQDYDVASFSRTSIHDTAGTLTAAGSVVRIARTSTQTGATLTDSVIGLEINMGATSTGEGIFLNNDAIGGIAFSIDAENTTADIIDIQCAPLTTAFVIDLSDADGLTTGGIIRAISNSSDTGTRNLIFVHNNHASANDTVVLSLRQDSTDHTLFIDHDGITGSAIYIDAETTTGVAVDLDFAALTTGKGIDMSNLDAITTGKAIHIDATGTTQTDGILVHIDSACTTMTSTGRLLLVDHTGNAAVNGIVAEVASAAADETTVFRVTASGVLAAGVLLDLSGAAVTTGTILDMGGLDALTTGTALNLVSNSASNGTRKLVNIVNDNTGATGTTPLYIQQDALTSTNFKLLMTLGTISIYVSDQTSPNTALTAVEGSICLNGSATGQAFWNTDGSTAWTALA